MQNEIVKNCVVTLDYTVTDPDGTVIDDGRRPLVYLHGGYDGIFPKLEEALHGKKVGENLRIKLQPEDAFGDYDEKLVAVEDADMFPEDAEVGMAFERVSDAGEILYRITEIAEGKVVVDGNHPLAGMALIFDMTVTSVRNATAEELAHGHIHDEDHDDDEDDELHEPLVH
jgi:FKBP-type peptidyl-prolyl cis-trans isomerase SlyD